MKAVNVGILGLGTVGGGALEVLRRNANEISARAGREIHVVKAAVRDISRRRANTENLILTDSPLDVVNDPNISIIVELMGGDTIAKEAIIQAINNGKQVITANKALIAVHGNEIFSKAEQHGVSIAFEAAVAGGVPIIKSIREGLAGNRIKSLAGIINGTCNYILSLMEEGNHSFSDALEEAQKLGYAEADPTLDIEGVDAAHKLAILASIAFGMPLQFEQVYTQGITKITQVDILFAAEIGYRIKHLGIARRTTAGIELRVHPTLIPSRCPLANVSGVINAILVDADAVGSTFYYGAGAGAEATASSVVADLVDVVRTLSIDSKNRVPHLAFQPSSLTNFPILPMEQVKTAYYLRLTAINHFDVLAKIIRIFSDNEISIDRILQKKGQKTTTYALNENVTIIMLTQKTYEKNLNQALKNLSKLSSVNDEIIYLRLEDLS